MQATMTMTLKEEAESYFGGPIPKNEYDVAVDRAKRKLARIIEREGDSNGERRKQYYLAQLISEEVQANRFSDFTIAVCKAYEEIDRYVEQIQKGIKKEMPAARAARQI